MSFEHAETIIEKSRVNGAGQIKIVHHHHDNWCNLSDESGNILGVIPLSLADYDKLLNKYMSFIHDLDNAGSVMYLRFRN